MMGKLLPAISMLRNGFVRRMPRSHALCRQYATQGITQPSFWRSLVPKPLRKSPRDIISGKTTPSKEWNPATFFILIFLLIGSMSIQMIALRNEFATFSRRADVRIGLLKEIVQRVQCGEEVDVEKLLGTGDQDQEKEWEEVLEQIAKDDQAWEASRKPKPSHRRPQNELAKGQSAGGSGAQLEKKEQNEAETERPKGKSNVPSGYF